MQKRLVLIGGGHAHMTTLASLARFRAMGHQVTVIGPSPYHYYSGMGPGMLAGTYRPEEIRFATRRVVERQGAVFVLGTAVRIDPVAKLVHLAAGGTVPYDVLSCNAGSVVPRSLPGAATFPDLFAVKPIERLIDARQRLLDLAAAGRTLRVAVVGGGPSAVEVAGNAWRLLHDAGIAAPAITIFAGRELMARLPEPVRQRARRSLTRRGIRINEPARVRGLRPGAVVLDTGAEQGADFVFLALGINPSPLFADSGLPVGPDGGLLVNAFLQCPSYPEIFGGGDCIHFVPQPLDKVGVYAVRQNPVLRRNLLAALEGAPLQSFDPGGDYLLIYNLGDGTGILRRRRLIFGGRPAFWLKDYIDRRFMRRFQALE
ncbi:MAG: FAD-dependent oxidoreductase [Thermodesulfobacteriota bacterium]